MSPENNYTRLDRRNAESMDKIVRSYIKSLGLSRPLNSRRIFAAWDEVSGAGPYTLKKFFRDGRLYITLGSSMIRSQLYYQKDVLIEKINQRLTLDPLFTFGKETEGPVKEIILK